MSSEIPDPVDIARHSAISLATGGFVNGLPYHRFVVGSGRINRDNSSPDSVGGPMPPVMFLYYPADTIAEDIYSAAVRLGPGELMDDMLFAKIVSTPFDDHLRHSFIRNPVMSGIVDFARGAYEEGISLQERRKRTLREYQAPLAALAISSVNNNEYLATVTTPYFVWPWAAYAEMTKHLQG